MKILVDSKECEVEPIDEQLKAACRIGIVTNKKEFTTGDMLHGQPKQRKNMTTEGLILYIVTDDAGVWYPILRSKKHYSTAPDAVKLIFSPNEFHYAFKPILPPQPTPSGSDTQPPVKVKRAYKRRKPLNGETPTTTTSTESDAAAAKEDGADPSAAVKVAVPSTKKRVATEKTSLVSLDAEVEKTKKTVDTETLSKAIEVLSQCKGELLMPFVDQLFGIYGYAARHQLHVELTKEG